MKVELKKGFISVESSKLVAIGGYLSGGRASARSVRAMAFFPFIFFRNREEMLPWVINHERIHFRQQMEMLWVGLIIFSFFEWLYAIIVLKKSTQEAYLWKSSEQEAYRNQQDFDYLKNRKPFTQFWYLTHKRRFTFGNPGEIIFKDSD